MRLPDFYVALNASCISIQRLGTFPITLISKLSKTYRPS